MENFPSAGSELLLVLTGPETEARLQYKYAQCALITAKFTEQYGLDMEYGASWEYLVLSP